MLYVAVDIGCIDCGEESAVLGVFESKEKAEEVISDHIERWSKNCNGDHDFEIFEVDGLNNECRVEYKKNFENEGYHIEEWPI